MEDINDQLRHGFDHLKETLGPMQKYVTPTSALVGLGAGLSVYWLIKRSKYNLPPGPRPIPLVGNYSLIGDRDLHAKCVQLSQKYGHPVITIYMGNKCNSFNTGVMFSLFSTRETRRAAVFWTFCLKATFPMVIVNTIEAATEVLVKKKADFADRPQLQSTNDFTDGGKNIAFANYTPTWKLHRKIASWALRNYLKGTRLENAVHGSLSEIIELFENLEGESFVPHSYIDFAVFNIICGLCFKKVYKLEDPKFKRLVEVEHEILTNFGSGFIEDIFPILVKICPSRRYKKAMQLGEEMLQFVGDELQDHRKSFVEGNIRDFTDALIQARREAEDNEDEELLEQLTDVHLKQTLYDIFSAGFDTSRLTLQWFLLYMAANPEEQKIAQNEIDKAVGRGRLPGLGDRDEMPYTEAVLHEVMRIATVAPFGLPHAARNDSNLYGYDIPKGTIMVINQWALHNDPQHWKDPSKFDPKRFLNSDGTLAPTPVSWLPFSAGRRVCLGESVAKPELHLICAIFLHQFDILLPPGVAADFTPDISGFAGYTANQFKITVKKRS